MDSETLKKRCHKRLAARGCSQDLTIKVINYALKCRQDGSVSTVIGAEYNKIKKTGKNRGYKITKLHRRLKNRLKSLGAIGTIRVECPYPIGNCAEVDAGNKVLRSKDTALNKIVFSEAIRPRTMEKQATCKNCIDTFK